MFKGRALCVDVAERVSDHSALVAASAFADATVDLCKDAQFLPVVDLRKLFKSTLNNRLHRNLACVIDKSSRGAKLERAFEELP